MHDDAEVEGPLERLDEGCVMVYQSFPVVVEAVAELPLALQGELEELDELQLQPRQHEWQPVPCEIRTIPPV